MDKRKLRIGLLVNPVAGAGGPAALKGSDAPDTIRRAYDVGVDGESISKRIVQRVRVTINELLPVHKRVELLVAPGVMGYDMVHDLPLKITRVGALSEGAHTESEDTKRIAGSLLDQSVDILLFAGGDGTARDICDVVSSRQTVLGIPCGVKMHSGVFAITPLAAGKILYDLALGNITSAVDAEVRDIDEEAFRQGIVRSKYYGEMTVPQELHYVQQTKSGGREVEELVLQEIAAEVIEGMDDDVQYLVGSGSTTAAVMASLKLNNTLLGVDVIRNSMVVQSDVAEPALFELVSQTPSKILITVIGGQGHLFGRGNQQFSPRVIRAVGLANIQVIATKTKLEALAGNLLIVDTGDPELDEALAGIIRVITGYEDSVLCRIG